MSPVLADSTVVEIEDSYTLVPLDQPEVLARCLRDFIPVGAPQASQ
jgi:hypothetical protein